ncbi:unnamed protein product [Dibothriocephalus latus]|uniref:Uncharacterized protein n=1 Tax=Dibothriocephalus latus TaxID=60516 RepID=A0A3P6QMR2_DIBLA|nr:unnamed protein product [Dibothriocephalus latus]
MPEGTKQGHKDNWDFFDFPIPEKDKLDFLNVPVIEIKQLDRVGFSYFLFQFLDYVCVTAHS